MKELVLKEENRDHPGVVARPPIIYLTFLLIGLLADCLRPMKIILGHSRLPAGLFLLAAGITLLTAGFSQMRGAGTPVNPRETPKVLVISGLFRYSRNPLYVSLTVIYAGIAILFASLWLFILLAPLLAVMHYGVIRREERYLEEKFGREYLEYKHSVRRWL